MRPSFMFRFTVCHSAGRPGAGACASGRARSGSASRAAFQRFISSRAADGRGRSRSGRTWACIGGGTDGVTPHTRTGDGALLTGPARRGGKAGGSAEGAAADPERVASRSWGVWSLQATGREPVRPDEGRPAMTGHEWGLDARGEDAVRGVQIEVQCELSPTEGADGGRVDVRSGAWSGTPNSQNRKVVGHPRGRTISMTS